jgi:CRP-like cAMP-binding protein
LLATFLAVNGFFWFVDPFQGVLGNGGAQLLRSLVLTLTAIALFRSWSRDQATYRRESSSESLRRQLRDLPGLDAALDGRSLEALSPTEVYTLVKALPAIGRQQALTVYRGVMAEMLRSGRLERAAALLELQDLRQTLALDDADHHTVVRLLAAEDPALLQNDRLQRQRDDLRFEAATDAVADLLRRSGHELLSVEHISPALRASLDRVAETSGLNPAQWEQLLESFGPSGDVERQRLTSLRQRWLHEHQLYVNLAAGASGDFLLRPLLQVLIRRSEALRSELAPRLAAAGLAPLPVALVPSDDPDSQRAVLELLWLDSDPDTAGWVLMLARDRAPDLAARLLQTSRDGLSDSEFLQQQRHAEFAPRLDMLSAIASSELFGDLLPSGVLWLADQGTLCDLAPQQCLMQVGDHSDSLALVLSGSVVLTTPSGYPVELGPGQSVGEMGVITGRPRSATVLAGPKGAQLLMLPAGSFESLLIRSAQFSRGLLTQLAERLSGA